MPKISKGGKFIFGLSLVRPDLNIFIPPEALKEYALASEGKIFLISGSKRSGGFAITRKDLLYNSKIKNILTDTPLLYNYELPEGDFVKYKGRLYCWAGITSNGKIKFTDKMLQVLDIQAGTELLVIRSSNIALGLAAKGLLLEKIKDYRDRIKTH